VPHARNPEEGNQDPPPKREDTSPASGDTAQNPLDGLLGRNSLPPTDREALLLAELRSDAIAIAVDRAVCKARIFVLHSSGIQPKERLPTALLAQFILKGPNALNASTLLLLLNDAVSLVLAHDAISYNSIPYWNEASAKYHRPTGNKVLTYIREELNVHRVKRHYRDARRKNDT
jgi:hypothetical protein